MLAAAILTSAGCASGRAASPPVVPAAAASTPGAADPAATHLGHVVIVVQENRSFDDFFHGFKGARYATYGFMHNGTRVRLHEADLRGPDISHVWHDAVVDWDHGKMDGFDLNPLNASKAAGAYAYAYVGHRYIQPYWEMARQYVLADQMFPTMFGGSFTAHLDLIAATTNLQPALAEVDTPLNQPWGCDAPAGTKTSTLTTTRSEDWGGGPFPCFTQFRTMADTMDAAHVSWKYYAPAVTAPGVAGKVWSEFDAIADVRHTAQWAQHVISPPSTVLTDAKNGKLPSVAWVIPDAADSDHAGEGSDTGPSWVASVVNAIGESSAWNSTAIVVLWDDWGGWYDSVPPPQLDFRGLGIRVPCIIISPYARKGYVSHTQYEFGSILKFVEDTFRLPRLASLDYGSGYTDARANSIADSFDFKQKPRRFEPIAVKYPASHFLLETPSLRVPDDE